MKTDVSGVPGASRLKSVALYGLAAVLIFLGGGLVAGFNQKAVTTEGDTLEAYDQAAGMGGDFVLTGHNGDRVSLKDYRGKVVVMFFGFTNCPVACPTVLNDMVRVVKNLGDKADGLQVLFVTVDPERDSPEKLKEYVTYFHPDFMALTGSLEEIGEVARQYGTKFLKVVEGSEKNYAVAHSVYLYVIDKEGKVNDLYHFQTPMEEVQATIEKLIDQKI